MVDDIRNSKRSSSSVDDELSDKADIQVTEDDDEVSFVPPEKIAEEEEIIDLADNPTDDTEKSTPKHQKSPDKSGSKLKLWIGSLKQWWSGLSKKQKIIIGIAGIVFVILLIGGGVFALHKPPPKKVAPVVQKTEVKKELPKPTTEPSHLTGVPVSPELNLLPVTAVMIENSPDARPQSGLNDAGVVFEAIAEGGITRFLTLFQESQPDYIGPVRSVRPYYLQWLRAFDAAVAHVGGSGEALAKINRDGIKDLDQSFNGGSYQRISQRYAPHNVYTSLGSLLALEKGKGYTSSTFTSFARKQEKPVPTPTAKSIDIAISGPLYNVHYDYHAAENNYARSEGGTPHKDERSGKQLSPKVVIAIVLPQGIDPDGVHTSYNPLGNGTAYIFQDGNVTVGTWSKPDDKEQIRFGDANGAPIGLNAGQTWVTAVGSAPAVTYTP